MENNTSTGFWKRLAGLWNRNIWRKVWFHLCRGNWEYILSRLADYFRQPLSSPPLSLEEITNHLSDSPPPSLEATPQITVAIPVYNGWDHLEPLFSSLFAGTRLPHHLVVIDDQSTDKRVWPYLQKLAASHSHLNLWQNSQNLGFVATVNRVLRKCQGHIVILNSDVQVPPGWLERLIAPLQEEMLTASATPFSNAGSLVSFPQIFVHNPLPGGLKVEEVDKVFQKISPLYPEIPTGVGFCLALHQKAIQEIGIFDEEAFGRGYGEEVDWCRRAKKAGYKNILVDNLFVYHHQGGSFSLQERENLQKKADAKLHTRYPEYSREVHRFARQDPLRTLREALCFFLHLDRSDSTLLIVDHKIGGGTNAYRQRLVKKRINQGLSTLLITYHLYRQKYSLSYFSPFGQWSYSVKDLTKLDGLFSAFAPDEALINNLVSFPEPLQWLKRIQKWIKKFQIPLSTALHDYYPLCPSFQLIHYQGRFCQVPSLEECRRCLPQNQQEWRTYLPHPPPVKKWRENWFEILKKSRLLTFSKASLEIFNRAYPQLSREIEQEITPHEVPEIEEVKQSWPRESPLKVGVLGKISQAKGAGILRKMARLAAEQDLSLQIVVIGELMAPGLSPYLIETGPYRRVNLPKHVKDHKIDIILIPSIWPETFSYTTHEACQMGLPLAVFDLGAPAERAREYDKGLIISPLTAQAAIDHLVQWKNQNL